MGGVLRQKTPCPNRVDSCLAAGACRRPLGSSRKCGARTEKLILVERGKTWHLCQQNLREESDSAAPPKVPVLYFAASGPVQIEIFDHHLLMLVSVLFSSPPVLTKTSQANSLLLLRA
jgi:hypothetical protein